jgi:hypothetical protein
MPKPDFETLLSGLTHELDGPETLGLVLSGSYARGQTNPYSDVDFSLFVDQAPRTKADGYRLSYRKGSLISLKRSTFADYHRQLTDPKAAIWAVPGLSNWHILLDKTGEIARLQAAAQDFSWAGLQDAAN